MIHQTIVLKIQYLIILRGFSIEGNPRGIGSSTPRFKICAIFIENLKLFINQNLRFFAPTCMGLQSLSPKFVHSGAFKRSYGG